MYVEDGRRYNRSRGASHAMYAGILTWVEWDNKLHTLQENAKLRSLHLWLVFLCTVIKPHFEHLKIRLGLQVS